MKKFLTLFFVLWALSGFSQTQVSGEQTGVWTKANSPYQVIDSILVPAGDTLTIEAGVKVEFQGHYKILVMGVLQAAGTQEDTIFFTPVNTTTGWGGISLGNSVNGNITSASGISNFSYCVFEYAKTLPDDEYPEMNGAAVRMLNSDALYDNCIFRNNDASPSEGMGGAVYAINTGSTTEPVTKFTDCKFIENKAYSEGGAIKFTSDFNTEIYGCEFWNNTTNYGGGAIMFYSVVGTKMIKCLFVNNSTNYDNGGATKTLGSDNSIYFKNCTMVKNKADNGSGGALALYYGSADFVNCIVYDNTSQYDDDNVYIDAGSGTGTVNYCNITMPEYNTTGSNNIETDPLFVDYDNDDYHLQETSPCIDAGTDIGLPYEGTAPDMGCYEYSDSVPDTLKLTDFSENIQLYPNPTSGIINLSYYSGIQEVIVFDEAGRAVKKFKNEPTINLFDLDNGIYYISIKTSTRQVSRKIILIK